MQKMPIGPVDDEAGLVGEVGALNIQQTDYNNDGLLDIWMLRGGWLGKAGRMPSSLLRNNGDGTFTDVTQEAGLMSFHPTQTSRWFDYDGDGWLDLFVGHESTDRKDPDWCELYHNNRDGTFTECARACGIRIAAFKKGVACADYDNDGRPDLYLSVRGGKNILLHNDGPDDPAQPRAASVVRFFRGDGLRDPANPSRGLRPVFRSAHCVRHPRLGAAFLGPVAQVPPRPYLCEAVSQGLILTTAVA